MELVTNRGFADVGRCRFNECPLHIGQVREPFFYYVVETQ